MVLAPVSPLYVSLPVPAHMQKRIWHRRRARPSRARRVRADQRISHQTRPFAIEDVVDPALSIKIDGAGFVPRDKLESHLFEQRLERLRLGMGEFHEFESIGASGVFGADFGRRRIVRKRAHIFPILP